MRWPLKEYADIGMRLGADAWLFGKATAIEDFPGFSEGNIKVVEL